MYTYEKYTYSTAISKNDNNIIYLTSNNYYMIYIYMTSLIHLASLIIVNY